MADTGQTPDWKWLITIVLAIGILGAMTVSIREESAGLAAQVEGADQLMARMETAIHVLAGSQDEKIRRVVDQALTVAQDPAASATEALAGVKDNLQKSDFPKAAEALRSVRTLLMTAKGLKTAMPLTYFSDNAT